MTGADSCQTIARELAAACPPGFEEARIDAQLDSGWSHKTYRCKVAGAWSQDLSVPAGIDFAIDDALHDLRATMRQDGRPAWDRCSFRLRADGSFTLDVAYPD